MTKGDDGAAARRDHRYLTADDVERIRTHYIELQGDPAAGIPARGVTTINGHEARTIRDMCDLLGVSMSKLYNLRENDWQLSRRGQPKQPSVSADVVSRLAHMLEIEQARTARLEARIVELESRLENP